MNCPYSEVLNYLLILCVVATCLHSPALATETANSPTSTESGTSTLTDSTAIVSASSEATSSEATSPEATSPEATSPEATSPEATSPVSAITTSTSTSTPNAAEGRTKSCNVLAGIDEVLYDHYDRNITRLTQLVQDHFRFVNNIFGKQVLNSESGFSDVYFQVERVQIFFGTCDHLQDSNCTTKRDEYLKRFDSFDFADFCLAYIFTFIDFSNGTAGYAYIGTVCRPIQNSGFITLLNHGKEMNLQESGLFLAHELGHNFGAIHDIDTEDESCMNKGYIMTGTKEATDLMSGNRNLFSPCSINKMKEKTLSKIGSEIHDCFRSVPYDPQSEPRVSICGNGILEPGEECDCGYDEKTCTDHCCYPAQISDDDRYYNKTAIPCTKKGESCKVHPGLVFGIYVPLGFILCCALITAIFLRQDWMGDKKCFTHITQNNIRIIRGTRR